MTESMKFNGWTNRETWLVNLYFEETFQQMKNEGWDADRDVIKEYIADFLDQHCFESPNDFIQDVITGFFDKIDFDEIVEHIEAD